MKRNEAVAIGEKIDKLNEEISLLFELRDKEHVWERYQIIDRIYWKTLDEYATCYRLLDKNGYRWDEIHHYLRELVKDDKGTGTGCTASLDS